MSFSCCSSFVDFQSFHSDSPQKGGFNKAHRLARSSPVRHKDFDRYLDMHQTLQGSCLQLAVAKNTGTKMDRNAMPCCQRHPEKYEDFESGNERVKHRLSAWHRSQLGCCFLTL